MKLDKLDRFGNYGTLTGHEGTGQCFSCGGDLPSGRFRYCSDKCRDNYWAQFDWQSAVSVCLKRANNRCEECGSIADIEVHHIEALNGEPRWNNPKNKPGNLIVLCRECHKKKHRFVSKGNIQKQLEAGQLFFEEMRVD